ncbi:MAG TPA: hypothetical protein VMW42_04615, partial [Desulfatiglandales bacterium]|nr:hypothetical protein [Desulfatiglandales bacterium]
TKSTEYYINNDVVMLSEINDPKDVARCIREIYWNPSKRSTLSRNGLNYIKRNNWNLAMGDFFRIVDELVS